MTSIARTLTPYIYIAAAALLCGCSDSDGDFTPPTPRPQTISFDVAATDAAASTRSLINNNSNLQHACTPVENGGEGKAVGFWIDYLDRETHTVTGNAFGSSAQLIYKEKAGSSHMWNYAGADQLWADKGNYVVRAFYPQSMASEVVDASTSAQLFVIEYNTHTHQEDLMLAANEVIVDDDVSHAGSPSIAMAYNASRTDVVMSTVNPHPSDNTKYGFSQTFNLNDPIPLKFQHALAAVRIRFTFAFDHEDELIGVSLHNDGYDNGLHTVGVLVYGDEADSYFTPVNATMLTDRYQSDWFTYQTSWDGIDYYSWEIDPTQCADGRGIPISRQTVTSGATTTVTEHMAVAYSKTNRHVVRTTVNGGTPTIAPNDAVDAVVKRVKAESDPSHTGLPLYNENEGHLLLIPQEAPSAVTMKVKFRNLGEHHIVMPAYTGTDETGAENADPSKNKYFVAGHRYTYTVMIDKMDCEMTVDVEEWNNYNFDYNIKF